MDRVNVSDFFEKLPHTYTSKCKICGRIVSNVKNHYLTHNPGNFVCPICGCRRTRLDNLKVHIKQKHPDLVIEYKYQLNMWIFVIETFFKKKKNSHLHFFPPGRFPPKRICKKLFCFFSLSHGFLDSHYSRDRPKRLKFFLTHFLSRIWKIDDGNKWLNF